MLWINHNWYGYLRIRISGYSPERFLNLCSANGIEIWGLTHQDGMYEYYMTVKDFRKSKPLVRKAKVQLKILEKLGLPFFLHKNRKRKLFFVGFISFFLLLFMMSRFVWDISFEGNYHYTDDTLIRYFESCDIYYGMRKGNISCEEIEAGIRNQFPEITWVSARVSGTRLLVKIKENEVLSSIPDKNENPCEIVADKEGIITRMVVRQGVAQVAIGDEVEMGQLLVSSEVPITNDSEELVRIKYVHADADIYARTTYSFSQKIPSVQVVKAKTGQKKNGFYMKVLDYKAVIMLPRKEEQLWDFMMEEHQLKIFENFYLPVYYGKIKGEAYSAYEQLYTEEEKKSMAEHQQNAFLENLLEKGVHIIENDVKILGNGSACQIQGYAIIEELIGSQQEIIESEIEENIELDEHSGDNH